jgi:hypothetical protein
MRRAAPITAFTSRADQVKEEVEKRNVNALPAPEKTKSRRRSATTNKAQRGLMPQPAPPLSEMIDENGEVHPPKVAMTALLPHQKNRRGGIVIPEDVVVLPSGMAVRFKEEPKSELELAAPPQVQVKEKAKRKRKSQGGRAAPTEIPLPQVRGTIEVLPYGSLMPPPPPPLPPPPPPAHQQQISQQHLRFMQQQQVKVTF